MIWTRTSYRCETSGDYAVTGHKVDGRVWFIAWAPKLTVIGEDFATADDAKRACFEHKESK